MYFLQIVYRNSVRTSQETQHVSVTKPNRFMLLRETIAVYCESHKEHNIQPEGRMQNSVTKKQAVQPNFGGKIICFLT
jgi:hypothetical protein